MAFAARHDTPVDQTGILTTIGESVLNGAKIQGEALAAMFLEHVKQEGGVLIRFMKDLFDLSLEGRKAFRTQITHMLAEQRKYVESHKGKKNYESLAAALRSSSVRMSEAVTMSKAFDAGFNPQWEMVGGAWQANIGKKRYPYHALVGAAREHLKTNAAGPTQLRGRKAKPALQKVEEYIFKIIPELSKEDLAALKEWINNPTDPKASTEPEAESAMV